jgi:DNA replication protein DnaC
MKNRGFRKVFPGANTSQGFFSYYQHIIPPDANRIFVLKGGPGVGKSTFIKTIGEAVIAHGYSVEFHCCSSDNASFDGVAIPKIGVALIDGTAPHIVDPRNPGAVDEIIHLGDHWNEAGIRTHKEKIIKTNKEISRLFRQAYGYLAHAKLLNDEIESYYLDGEALDIAGLNIQANQLIKEILKDSLQKKAPKSRHLFASAISPDGLVNHFDTIFESATQRYLVSGEPGTGKSTIIQKIYNAAMNHGYDVEAFHCALNPSRIEHIMIPQLGIAVITCNSIHPYLPQPEDTVLNTEMFVYKSAVKRFTEDMDKAQDLFLKSLQRATGFIAKAKKARDELEACYIPYMDFTAINKRRDSVFQKILNDIEPRFES